MKGTLQTPSWLVKKAKLSITLCHFYKIEKGEHPSLVYAHTDWVIVVSWKKGLDVKIYDVKDYWGKWEEYFEKHNTWLEGYSPQGEWSLHSLKSKKWVRYMGHDFIPSQGQSTKALLSSNPAIRWHVVEAIFEPDPTFRR